MQNKKNIYASHIFDISTLAVMTRDPCQNVIWIMMPGLDKGFVVMEVVLLVLYFYSIPCAQVLVYKQIVSSD